MTETLIALPVLLVFMLCVVQFALIYRTKVTLEYASHEAARSGSLNNAMPLPLSWHWAGWLGKWGDLTLGSTEKAITRESVWQGLVKGMMPLSTRKPDMPSMAKAWFDTNLELIEAGCIEYVNPTQNAFMDWGFMENSGPDRWILRLPNDTMRYRKPLDYDYKDKRLGNPAPGAGASKPIPQTELRGSVSNRTLGGANVLHLRVHYGYKLNIPIANTIIIKSMQGYKAVAGALHRVMSTASDQAPAAETTMTALDAYYLRNGRFPLVAEGVVGMETPVHWHPFFSFGPSTENNYSSLHWDAAWSVQGTNYLEPIVDTVNQVLQFIRSGPQTALGYGVKAGFDPTSDAVGDLNHFCPTIWLDGHAAPLRNIPNPFAAGPDGQARAPQE